MKGDFAAAWASSSRSRSRWWAASWAESHPSWPDARAAASSALARSRRCPVAAGHLLALAHLAPDSGSMERQSCGLACERPAMAVSHQLAGLPR
jgi:hypothetical protein